MTVDLADVFFFAGREHAIPARDGRDPKQQDVRPRTNRADDQRCLGERLSSGDAREGVRHGKGAAAEHAADKGEDRNGVQAIGYHEITPNGMGLGDSSGRATRRRVPPRDGARGYGSNSRYANQPPTRPTNGARASSR